MRILLFAFVLFAFAKTTHAQGLTDEEMDPRVTEQYLNIPIVTPSGKTGGPPADAIVLFDGTNLDKWKNLLGNPAHWMLEDGAMTVSKGIVPYPPGGDIMTRDSFENIQLHLEFRTPSVVVGDGQGRGNSGLFFQDRYEIQILDNYDNETYSNGQIGAIYKQTAPMANPARKPGEWQTYDIVYTAPVFSSTGRLIHPAYITAFLNGVIVQNHTAIQGTTPYKGRGVYEAHGPAPIKLQDHGNPMSFRNIWVRKL